MRAREWSTAWFLRRTKFHVLDAYLIGVVQIQLVFAIASHLLVRSRRRRPAALRQLGYDGVHVDNPQRKVVCGTKSAVARMWRQIEHVLNPICTIWHLQGDKIGHSIFHAASPVEAKPEELLVKAVLHGRAADHKTCMNDARANGLRIGRRMATHCAWL